MLVKSITTSGDIVPLSPEEALVYAIGIALSNKSSEEHIYWSHDKAPTIHSFNAHLLEKGNYDAYAKGTVLVGKTKIKEDRFYTPELHEFSIHYKSSKDPIGAPHLEVPEFTMEKTSWNPAKNVGPIPAAALDNTKPVKVLGEIVPTTGGKVYQSRSAKSK